MWIGPAGGREVQTERVNVSSDFTARRRCRVPDSFGARRRFAAVLCSLVAALTMLGASQAAGQIAHPADGRIHLFDGHGFDWDVYFDGSILNGHIDAYDFGHQFYGGVGTSTPLGPYTTYTTEESGREIVVGSTTIDGVVSVSRKVYVAPTPGAYGFARFLDIFTNLTASTQIVPIRIHTNLGLDNAGTYWQTSSGDSTYTTADYWVVTDDAQGVGVADPVVTQVYGDGTFPPTSATQTAVDNYET